MVAPVDLAGDGASNNDTRSKVHRRLNQFLMLPLQSRIRNLETIEHSNDIGLQIWTRGEDTDLVLLPPEPLRQACRGLRACGQPHLITRRTFPALLMTRFPGELVNPRRRPPPGTSATAATSAQSRVRSTALARGLGPALVSAAAEEDRVGGAELLSDQLAQLIVA